MGFGCAAGSSGWLPSPSQPELCLGRDPPPNSRPSVAEGKNTMVTRTTAAPHTSTSAAKSIVDRLILVSNRGPVTHQLDESGRIRRMDADGGVAVALASVARSQPVTWIAGACTFADRIVALTGKPVRIGEDSHVKLVNLPEDVYRPFYQSLCTDVEAARRKQPKQEENGSHRRKVERPG
jgi:trehalose-6-phosphate synthase